MNQTQRLIDSIRDAPHDAVIVAGMFAIPALIALWIVNRMRHPERGLLHALVIASVGFVLVPSVSRAVLSLWVRTGGDSIQASLRKHLCLRVWLLGLSPLVAERPTSREAYEGSCSPYGSSRPSIRSSG